MQDVADLPVVRVDTEAQEIVAVFIFQLHWLFVEMQGCKLPDVGIVVEDVLVDDDRPVVDISANPELISEVSVCDVLAEETEPRDLRRDDGTCDKMGLI